jgi:hypothetical protein
MKFVRSRIITVHTTFYEIKVLWIFTSNSVHTFCNIARINCNYSATHFVVETPFLNKCHMKFVLQSTLCPVLHIIILLPPVLKNIPLVQSTLSRAVSGHYLGNFSVRYPYLPCIMCSNFHSTTSPHPTHTILILDVSKSHKIVLSWHSLNFTGVRNMRVYR